MMNQATPEGGLPARLLPFPSMHLYVDLTPATVGAVWPQLVAHGHAGRLTPWQRLSGNVTPARKVWHLIYLHRRAFEAEMIGYRHQADFYWRALSRRLRRMWHDSAAWNAAAAQIDVTSFDGTALRDLCMGQLFLDSHIALAHGLIREGAPYRDAQLALHLTAFERLLRVKGAGELEIVEALHPLVAAQIDGLRAAQMNTAALARLRRIDMPALKLKFAAVMADLIFSNLMVEIERLPKDAEPRRIGLIAVAINEIEELRVARPGIAVLYQMLGFLHQMQCVQMANAEMLADSLVACEKASTYWPHLDKIADTRRTLHSKMTELEKFIDTVQRQARDGSGQTLSADGLRLQADAERGFMPVQNFIDSATRSAIIAQRDAALASSVADGEAPGPSIDARLCILSPPQRPGRGWSHATWLFAAQSGRNQALLAGALAFNLAVGAVMFVELSRRGQRDTALAELRAPDASDEQVMAASVRFLRTQTPLFRDPRSTEVSDAYAYAFTRWFGNVADPSSPLASTRVAEYRQLGSQGVSP